MGAFVPNSIKVKKVFYLRKSIKILLSAAGILCAGLIIGTLQFLIWNQYEPPLTVGSHIKTSKTNLTAVTREWYDSYIASLQGPEVPYDWRVHSARLTYILPLEQPGYVEVAYTIQPASRNLDVVSNLELVVLDSSYTVQTVLYWEQVSDGWELADTLTAAGYDLRFPDPRQQKENEIAENTHHYRMDDSSDQTYFVQNETLYVTYDGGNTSVEVPDGYTLVCMGPNEIPDEYLEPDSYVVSPEFTGFIGYDEDYAVLLYSEDRGQTWDTCRIGPGHKALSFLSYTENGCYAAFATDRSLGNDYYEAFYSEDLRDWHPFSIPEALNGHLTCAYWTSDGRGYFAYGTYGYVAESLDQEPQVLILHDSGDLTSKLGYDPFDEICRFYEEGDSIYAVIGQGDDGDYMVDGQLVQALYRSEDGVNFYFQETISDNPTEAG